MWDDKIWEWKENKLIIFNKCCKKYVNNFKKNFKKN